MKLIKGCEIKTRKRTNQLDRSKCIFDYVNEEGDIIFEIFKGNDKGTYSWVAIDELHGTGWKENNNLEIIDN